MCVTRKIVILRSRALRGVSKDESTGIENELVWRRASAPCTVKFARANRSS